MKGKVNLLDGQYRLFIDSITMFSHDDLPNRPFLRPMRIVGGRRVS
jgi:hypothetical protein